MKKILIAFLALVTALSCFAFIGCENKKEEIQANADKQATLDMYIFDKDGQTISEDFVLPGKIGKYDATWTSNNAIIALEELAGDEENGIERQYVAKVGLPEERTEVNLTVALSEEVTKSFTVYVNSLSVYDFSGAYNFIQNNGTVFTSFALDTTCEFKGHTATITWSVDEEYADYLEISEDGKECIVYPSSLNPQVRINATFAYKGETTTKGYRMTVSEQKEPLQEVDYWYTNTGVGIVMSGYVVSIATVYSESYGNVSLYMVNDEFTAGYYLYRVKADSQNAALLAPGVHITVTGTTNTNYNGLIETNAGGTLVVDADVPAINVNEKVYAIDNDIIGDLQSAHYNQSRLVSLTNWKVKEIKSAVEEGKTGTLFIVTKGGVDVSIAVSKYMEGAYLCNASDATWSALAALQTTVKVGDILSVTGVLGNYNGHQIMPLSAEAVVVGGTADADSTVYAGQKAAKAVAAIDKLIADNGLDSIVAVAKNVQLPATVEGCEVAFRVIGEPRSISIVDGALVINPGKMERACLTAVITVDGFTTNIFRYIEAADLDDAAKVELEEKELTFVTDEAINANTVLTVPVVGNLFNNVTISWASNNECAVVDGSTITITVPEEIVEVIFTATITLNNAVLTKEFVVEVGKPANISLVDFVALATGLEHDTVTTKKYLVSGIVTEIANTKYGNLYVTDAAGNTLYVYGCYDVDGTNRYDAMGEAAPQVGDYVVLFGVASNYNGPQMKNAWVQSCTSPISIEEATAIALALENKGDASTEKYLVTGTVTEIANATYGNLYITDDDGNKLYVYGVYSEDGSLRFDAMGEAAPQVGDVITVYGVASNYNGAQLKNVWVVLVTAGNHEHDFTGEWKSNASKHWHECVCGEIADEADHVYVEGVCECGAKEPVAGTVILTVDSLGVASQSYAAGTATVNGVSFEFIQIGNYGDGIQMRDKNGNTSMLWNTSAFGTGISKIELVYNSAKGPKDNADAVIFNFGNEVKGNAYSTKLSTVAGTFDYTITPDASTYTYFYLEHDLGYSFYWLSITIYFEAGEVTPPVECEHVWVDATCSAPKHCSVCKVTEGEALAHTFVDGACSVCGAEDPNYVDPEVSTWTLVTELKDGDQVLIGAHAYGKLLSAEKVSATSYYNKGVDYSIVNFANVTDAEIFVVTVNDDGTYTFTSLTGKVIALAAEYSSLNETGAHKSWALEDKGNGVYYVKNTGRNMYLEWYASKNNWSAYGTANSDLFEISFYAKRSETPVECEHTGGTATCEALAICANCGKEYGELAAHTWVDATCTAPKTCSVCEATEGEALAHTYVDGACSVCGATEPVVEEPISVTRTVSIQEHASKFGWENSIQYLSLYVDRNISVTVVGYPTNNYYNSGKYYTSGYNWRIYQNETPDITISAAEKCIIVSVKISYTVSNTGVLTLDGAQVESDAVVAVNASSIVFSVGNTGTASNGQVRITAIEVVYEAEAGVAIECDHEWIDATCLAPQTCSICRETQGETLPHTESVVAAVAPTCAETGLTEGKVCSVCNAVIVAQEIVAALGHEYVDGTCSRCGEQQPEGGEKIITASKTMEELISELGWTNTTTKQSFTLDDNVSVKINGGSNTGKAYNGDHIRIYATDSPAGTITISVAEGYELVSIKISANTGTYAFLCLDGSTTDISNVLTNVSGTSVLVNSVKNGTNGKQVQVTAIEVVYKVAE